MIMITVLRTLALLLGLGCLAGVSLSAQAGAVDGADTVALLEGRWDLMLDPGNRGLARGLPSGDDAGWSDATKVSVPGVLEASASSTGYDGVAWYRTRLPAAESPAADAGRLLLEFDAVNWRADVWLNGRSLGRHDGGDAPFRFDVSGLLGEPGAMLVVRCVDPGNRPVDGLVLAGLPNAAEGSLYNWGGITGSVRLRRVPLVEVLRHDTQLLPDGSVQLRLDLQNHGETPRAVSLDITASVLAELSTEDAPQHGENDAQLNWRQAVELPSGETRMTVPLPGAQALEHWSPTRPVSHALAIDVDDGGRVSRRDARLALRRFAVQDGRFTLDGVPLALRGVVYPPLYPRGLAHPPEADFLRRELLAIRGAGFNLVRATSRTQPELYALCDELGLLVCAEASLGEVTHELPETGPAALQAMTVLADAVAGHPSVVMANVLDELSGDLWTRQDELVAVARQRMPERLLIDESGGWQGGAQAWNPHDDQPIAIEDVHLPREGMPSAALRERVAQLGAGHDRLVWVSSWGVTGTPSFRDALAGFGGRLQSEDARDYASRLETIGAQVGPGTPLAALAPDVVQLTALGAASQARGTDELARLLRNNPRIAGDCFDQWRDAGWADAAGLCSVWGAPKPALTLLAARNAAGSTATERILPPPLPDRPARPYAAGTLVDLVPEVEAVVAGLVDRRPESFGGLPRVVVLGARPEPWSAKNVNVTAALLRLVRDGGTLLWLVPPDAGRPLPQQLSPADGCGQVADLPFDISCRRTRGPGVETFLAFATNSRLLADIPGVQSLPDERFMALQPEHVLLAGSGLRVDVQYGAIAADGSYAGAAVQSVAYGKGHIVLSTLPFSAEAMADPLARRLLENVVRYAAGIAGRKPAPPPVTDATPAPESVDGIAHMVWRAKASFGLAERLAQQDLPGRPMLRDELPELGTMIARKSAGLDAVIAGRSLEGLRLLTQLDEASFGQERENFVRAEVALADALLARQSGTEPLAPALCIAAERTHGRALRLMRLGETAAALEQLAAARRLTLAPAPAAGRPQAATDPALAPPRGDR